MRRLIIIPIIHTVVDLGLLADDIAQQYIKKFGRQRWKQHVNKIERFWHEVKKQIQLMKLDYRQIKLYQDGLPVSENAEAIVNELVKKGSANHKLLRAMMDQGAILVGTEDPELLCKEHQLAMTSVSALGNAKARYAPTKGKPNIPSDKSSVLLEQRDCFIAQRIHETLADGETGILFIGLLHQVQNFLDKKIEINIFNRGRSVDR